MKKISLLLLLAAASGCKQPAVKKPATADLSCQIDSSFTSFQDTIFTENTVFGLNGSQACYPLKAGNAPLTFDTPVAKGRTTPFDSLYWFPTQLAENLKYFTITMKQNPDSPGHAQVTLTPLPNFKEKTESASPSSA